MSHNIDYSTGKAAFASVAGISALGGRAVAAGAAWWGFGAAMEAGQTMEEWIAAAGLDWTAERARVRYATGTDQEAAQWQVWDEKIVIFRGDTKAPLGVVSDGFQIVQPREAIEVFETACNEYGYTLETAGALRGGRIVWGLAKAGEPIKIGGVDEVKPYALFATGLDGSLMTTMRHTTTRVECNNTLDVALNGKQKATYSKSHRSVHDRAEANRAMGFESFQQFAADAERMRSREVTESEGLAYFLKVYHGMTAETVQTLDDKARKPVDKTISRVVQLYQTAPGAAMAGATVWGLVNAVTRDVDFAKPAHNPENRLVRSWFGPDVELKAAAWDAALAMVA